MIHQEYGKIIVSLDLLSFLLGVKFDHRLLEKTLSIFIA